MHRIDRCTVPTPACLVDPKQRYGELHGHEKETIRAALLIIQGDRCAYCERRTGADKNDGHIEHFRNQANHQELDCEWNNLFWSCNDEMTCGRYKDKCGKSSGPRRSFRPDDIIDPANEEPEVLLLFVSDGTVRPRDGLTDAERHRAEETLRVFQLDVSPFLRKSRRDAVSPYIRIIDMLMKTNPNYVTTYVQSELGELDTTPFSTAIMSFLRSVI